MAARFKPGGALSQLSLTPLIDIVFLLLIFFLVATRFAEEEREMDVLLPEASAAQPLTSKPSALFINIDHEGRYYVTGKIVTLKELRSVLHAAYVNNPGTASAVIRADRRCQWEHVVAAMNACNRAKIRDYKVTTKEGPSD